MNRREFLRAVAATWSVCQGMRGTEMGADDSQTILVQATEGIEKHRKGEAIVEFVFPNGSPAVGVSVQVTQQSHDFLFG
ncbi:MAG: hypothetical protein ACK40X_11980, partial [Armatimonadota bacterium]